MANKKNWKFLISGLGGLVVLLGGVLIWLLGQSSPPLVAGVPVPTAVPNPTNAVPYPAINTSQSGTTSNSPDVATPVVTPSPATTARASTTNPTEVSVSTSVTATRTTISATAPAFATPPGATKITILANKKIQAEFQNLGLTVIYEPDSFAAAQLGEFVNNWQQALTYARERLKIKNPPAMTYELRSDGAPDPLGLGVRGFSDTPKNRVYQLYDGSGDSPDRRYITAHELGHILMNYKVGPGANLMLIEGIAMYASDEFLKRAGMISIHDFAVAAYEQKRLPTIGTISQPSADYNGRLTARLNYDLAGSFVSWLIETYGQDKFDKAYPGASYSVAYGKNLTELNQEWVKFLADRSKNQPLSFDSAKYFGYLDRVSADYQRLYRQAAQNNNKLNPAAYEAVDLARLATDRLDFAAADIQLQQFDKALP